jgi:subtilase family protein
MNPFHHRVPTMKPRHFAAPLRFASTPPVALRRFAVAALAAFAACAAPEGPTPAEAPSDAQSTQGISTQCPTRTAIWQNPSPGKPCKPVSDHNGDGNVWVGAPTFNADAPNTTYCKYTWNNPAVAPDYAELSAGLNPDHVTNLEPERDCPAVGVLSAPSPAPVSPGVDLPSEVADIWKPLHEHALRHAGYIQAPLPATNEKVRVAVLDTSKLGYLEPAPAAYDDADEHGRLVGRVIGDLACPGAFVTGAGCVAQIANYPALTRKSGQSAPNWLSGPPDGGYYGTLSELAEAIEHALADWNADLARGGPRRLVINLSVGWSPIFGGALVTSPGQPVNLNLLPKPARPVYAALARASCAGALVVAAAGNYDLTNGAGMVYPAAWESVPAPNANQCASYPLRLPSGVKPMPNHPSGDTPVYRPLVHAAGAVDAGDNAAGITRRHGRPRLAAYGVGVVTSEPRTDGVTRIKTGTSLSAAITSAAAALAWGYKPNLRPDQVMELVYKGGAVIAPHPDLEPNVCAGKLCAGEIHRVSVCAAAAQAHCDALKCSDLPCNAPPPFSGALPAPLVDWASAGFSPESVAAKDCQLAGACTWGGDTSHAEPWVGPQPGGGGCDTCVYSGTEGAIVIGLDEYSRACAYGMSATVEQTDGAIEEYELPPPPTSAVAPPSPAALVVPGPPPPPFAKGLYSAKLPVDPAKVRAITLWFHSDDAQHPGGAYTRIEGVPIVR